MSSEERLKSKNEECVGSPSVLEQSILDQPDLMQMIGEDSQVKDYSDNISSVKPTPDDIEKAIKE